MCDTGGPASSVEKAACDGRAGGWARPPPKQQNNNRRNLGRIGTPNVVARPASLMASDQWTRQICEHIQKSPNTRANYAPKDSGWPRRGPPPSFGADFAHSLSNCYILIARHNESHAPHACAWKVLSATRRPPAFVMKSQKDPDPTEHFVLAETYTRKLKSIF